MTTDLKAPPSVERRVLTSTARLQERVHRLCSSCHAFPPPASFPKDQWAKVVAQWYSFARQAQMKPEAIATKEEVIDYFVAKAPKTLEVPVLEAPLSQSIAGRFTRHHFRVPDVPLVPGVTNVTWVSLRSTAGLDCLVCDMRYGELLLWEHDRPQRGLQRLAKVGYPAHAEVFDLDGDGNRDVLVADMGDFFPGDSTSGRVVWVRHDPHSGDYVPIVLAEGLGRVADVQAADFDADGDADLIVAEFGWRTVGRVLYLENRTRDYSSPEFVASTIDPRTGTIHVPVADLNGDGRPDFVALLSQEHEQVVAFLNEGPGEFTARTMYSARNPAYGSTGIELVDFDRDGDLDVLYTNGDLMDADLLKPYHGVQWLENEGAYPFRHHPLAALPGVYRAVATDLDGDADTDVLAVTWLPDTDYPQREPFASIVWIEQTAPDRFVSHALEMVDCDHTTVDAADYDGDGDTDFVVGNMTWDGILVPRKLPSKSGWITIWENQWPPKGAS